MPSCLTIPRALMIAALAAAVALLPRPGDEFGFEPGPTAAHAQSKDHASTTEARGNCAGYRCCGACVLALVTVAELPAPFEVDFVRLGQPIDPARRSADLGGLDPPPRYLTL